MTTTNHSPEPTATVLAILLTSSLLCGCAHDEVRLAAPASCSPVAPPPPGMLADAYVTSLPGQRDSQTSKYLREDFMYSFFRGFTHPEGAMTAGPDAALKGHLAGQSYRRSYPSRVKEVMEHFGYTAAEAEGTWSVFPEASDFRPRSFPEQKWWLEALGDTGPGIPQDMKSRRNLRVRVSGFLSPAGRYGHFGGYDHEFLATNISRTGSSTLRYTNVEGFVRLEGSNVVHDWVAVGREIHCLLKVEPGFPAQPGQSLALEEVKAWCEVSIPVKSLKSIEKDGSPYSSKFDEVMYERLDETKHPTIRFRLEKLIRSGVHEGSYAFDASGELVVGGVTNIIHMPLRVTAMPGARLKLAGVARLKQGDFKILPGVVCFAPPRDDVRVTFNLTLAREGINGPD